MTVNSMVETKLKEGEARAQEGLLGLFDQFEASGRSKTPSWLQALHKGGIAHFADRGVPTTDHEEWRFTNVTPIGLTKWNLAAPQALSTVKEKNIAPFLYPELKARRLVFVDGYFSKELSSRDLVSAQGLKIYTLEAASRSTLPIVPQHLGRYARYDENPFVALNTAFLIDGVIIYLPNAVVAEEPIHILYVTTGSHPNVLTSPRTLIVAQRDSKVKVIETFASLGDATAFTNSVTEIVVEEGANVEHCKLQLENLSTYHVATIQTYQGRNSHLLSHSISIGGLLTRNNLNFALEGEGIECTMNGLYVGRDNQLVDHHTAIFHNKPNCNSHEFYHGILDGKSKGVFNGKIFVRPEAQKTDAKQTNRNMLLSDEATIDTKPQLEIFADDVKCTHGATIGQLDPESIFYLRSRGISLDNARKMLLHAFASEIVNRITLTPVRESLDAHLFEMYEK
jgi:Fe-S cluster assembly protein SufD